MEGNKEEDFFSTHTIEKSSLQTNVSEMDLPQRRVSAIIHSNWQTRYLSTMKVPSFFNKFLFISLQGKSHDKELGSKDLKNKQTKINSYGSVSNPNPNSISNPQQSSKLLGNNNSSKKGM